MEDCALSACSTTRKVYEVWGFADACRRSPVGSGNAR